MTRLTVDQLGQLQGSNEDYLLINTLDEEDFAATQIPGSINIPQAREDFVQQVERQARSKDQKIVVYCASQQCHSSTKGAQKLEQAGFTNVFDFEAGAEGWKESGHALATA